ncbi:hypothetical protein FXO38_21093 [Capsicum annuum]|nr:hypothetical protein FXO38_21093 [Capsicum annuum]
MFQVPIVRKTGGLADTVFDMDDQSHAEIANGADNITSGLGRDRSLLGLDGPGCPSRSEIGVSSALIPGSGRVKMVSEPLLCRPCRCGPKFKLSVGKSRKIFPNWAPGAMRRYRVVSLEIENWEIERWRDAELSRCPFLRDLELWRDAREIALRHSKKENYEFEYWRDAL